METTTARVTPGTHNPSISAQTVRNRLREAGLRACRPVVRKVLTRHHRQQRRLWAQTHGRWTRHGWQEVLFTNESRFCLTMGDGRICVYRQRNERYTKDSEMGSIWRWRVSHGLWRCVTESSDCTCCHFWQSQCCALQGRHPPPSCGILPAGAS